MQEILNIILFIVGSTLLIYAGKQDEKTRNPTILIPALVTIGLSSNILIGILILILSVITIMLPNSINKKIGKADIFLLLSCLLIIFSFNPLHQFIIYGSLIFTLISLVLQHKFNAKQKIPLITIFSVGYLITSLLLAFITFFLIVVVLFGF